MPAAARVGDTTTHGGTVMGPGVATVLIKGKPAAVFGDNHICSIPPSPSGHPTCTPFVKGSTKVMINNKPALRAGDTCVCGAAPAVGEPTVMIG